MELKKVLERLDFSPDQRETDYLKKETNNFIYLLEKEISKKKIDADVFIGGSFAKGTLLKSDNYDIDLFVRFDWKYVDLTNILSEIMQNFAKKNKLKIEKVHGSRDYFRISINKKAIFEVIPVVRIKKPREARNVTDLSYFHVNYVKKHLQGNFKKEFLLAKQFCKATGVYGAESYINGFSGYSLECLIIYFKSFEKMLKELIKIEKQIVIDPAKHYKKNEVFLELNESKLHSPLILIDPTWKERNVLAALNSETFKKFQESARALLKNPSEKLFQIKKFDENSFKGIAIKNNSEFLHLILKTNRQEGDIAGTKMKKFSSFLARELSKYFEILASEFVYNFGKKSDFYFVLKPKQEVIRIGPPITNALAVKNFKEKNPEVFEKNGFLHSRIKINFTAKQFINKFSRNQKKKLEEMSITSLEVV
ncbi:nucleotidyltransferase domain-containing protein [Candidatus Pacearchaeota archaeon]|nr:nucleotidyltransferase domain-containing protein [Candidatus Pacearchaeota archaeon]